MTPAPERGVPPDPIEAMAAALAASNPALYRHLALYLQVLRQVLPARVEQACFHIATQVHPQRYAALPAPEREALHGRILALVQRCSSLLTVEQLRALADQIDREAQLRLRRQQRELLERLTAGTESEDSSDDDAEDERLDCQSADPSSDPGFGASASGLPIGSIRLDFSLPLSADIGSWRAMGPASPGLAGFGQLAEPEGQGGALPRGGGAGRQDSGATAGGSSAPRPDTHGLSAQDQGSQNPGSQRSGSQGPGSEDSPTDIAEDATTEPLDDAERLARADADADDTRFDSGATPLDSPPVDAAALDTTALETTLYDATGLDAAAFAAMAGDGTVFDASTFDAAVFDAAILNATDFEGMTSGAADADTADADAASFDSGTTQDPDIEEPAEESLQQRLAQGPDAAAILKIVRDAMEDPRDPTRLQPSTRSQPGTGSPWREARLPRDPVTLLRWLDGFEQALLRRLRNLSHALNVELLRVGISRGLLPVSLLDAVLEGQVDTMASPSNVLHLQLPFSLRPGLAEVHALAILLRPVDLEMDEPRLRTCRRRLQQQRQELRRMAHQFRRLQRRLQAHEAERLWLQDIRNSHPPQA